MIQELKDRIIQTKPKLDVLNTERLYDQKKYYKARRHDYYTLLDNQLAIMEALLQMEKRKLPTIKRCKMCGEELTTKSWREKLLPFLFKGSGFCFMCVKSLGLKYLQNNPDRWWIGDD